MVTSLQPKTVVIAGGTGFLGRPLVERLMRAGHDVVILSRADGRPQTSGPPPRTVRWSPDGSSGPWASALEGADAVVNLAGESIAGRRWTEGRKQRIVDSRVLATRSLVAAIGAATRPPAVFVSGSAVGYYGPCGEESVAEDAPAGRDFLARVCVKWEAEAMGALSDRTRVVLVRTGLALERDGGALPAMLPPFWFGVGGPVGSGRQFWPWIHRQDWLSLVQFAIDTPAVVGAINATAPTPVTNRQFATMLGRAIHRPALLPAPGFALKLLLGEMADALLLSGQRAVPRKTEALGFGFAFSRLEQALADIFAAGSGKHGVN